MKMKIKSVTLFFILFMLVISQIQGNKQQKSEKDLYASIIEIEKKIDNNYQDILSKISEINKETDNKIKILSNQYIALRREIERLSRNQDSLSKQLSDLNTTLNNKIGSLDKRDAAIIKTINDTNASTMKDVMILKKSSMLRFFLAISAVLFSIFLIILFVAIFQNKFKQVNLVEESIKLDSKLSDILQNQLVLMKRESLEKKKMGEEVTDHSLPIRVGEEIFRMRKRISYMDPETKGLDSLKNALNRLEDEFNQQGFKINDLTGQQYIDGLIVKIVNAVEREDLKAGTQIISKMLTPQVYYKESLISPGEAELAVSSKNAK